MHSYNVWHRVIKSENVLLTGNMQAKLCDFGLSRSALETSSYMDAKSTTGRKKRSVLTRQYTKTVVTPSHRAPEVVMSQGQYTSAIDVWSVSCIFLKDSNWEKSQTRVVLRSYVRPLMLWASTITMCRAMDSVELPSEASMAIKQRLTHFIL